MLGTRKGKASVPFVSSCSSHEWPAEIRAEENVSANAPESPADAKIKDRINMTNWTRRKYPVNPVHPVENNSTRMRLNKRLLFQ